MLRRTHWFETFNIRGEKRNVSCQRKNGAVRKRTEDFEGDGVKRNSGIFRRRRLSSIMSDDSKRKSRFCACQDFFSHGGFSISPSAGRMMPSFCVRRASALQLLIPPKFPASPDEKQRTHERTVTVKSWELQPRMYEYTEGNITHLLEF